MAELKKILVKGARAHNLKNVDVELPRDSLVVFTGLSGSGKSSLAFDTIYAEGQRRYVESLSSYARMFLGQMEKPDVDYIEGLSPAISIDQKTTSKNPRSTVGTVTEVFDYLRLLYARIGIPHCPVCGREIRQQTVDEIVDRIAALPEGTKIQLLAPIVRGRKGQYVKELENARTAGYARARIDGEMHDLLEPVTLDKNKKHTIEIVVDRLVVRPDMLRRLSDSVETATEQSGGLLTVDVIGGEELTFSRNYACPEHGVSVEELSPRMFSFNNPFGACPKCTGLGIYMSMDPELIVPQPELSIRQGAIQASGWNYKTGGTIAQMYYDGLAAHYGFSLDTPYRDLPQSVKDILLYGTKGEKIQMQYTREYGSGTHYTAFEGILNNLQRRYNETTSEGMREELEGYMSQVECPECHGRRLKPESLAVTVGGRNIMEVCDDTVAELLQWVEGLTLTPREHTIGDRILKEIRERL